VMGATGKVPVPYSTRPDLIERVAALEARQPVLDFHPARCRFIQSRPRLRETYIQQAYLKMIEHAEEEILIANAYFVATPSVSLALGDAARRCVSINIISNSPETNDLPEISMVGRGHYKTLLEINAKPEVEACDNPAAGIRIWEWVGQAAHESARSQGTMHSKFAVVDSRRSLVGSYNLDPRSERLNSESAIVFEQEELAGRLRRLFLENDIVYSREVTLQQAREFEDPQDVMYRFRDTIGKYFEEEL
ncbi:MAG: phospholipase D-like domain-containing protein, partial [Halioglobus sp.]